MATLPIGYVMLSTLLLTFSAIPAVKAYWDKTARINGEKPLLPHNNLIADVDKPTPPPSSHQHDRNKRDSNRDTSHYTIASESKILGGWSMSLKTKPLPEFDYIMYGMVTNLNDLKTGNRKHPGWSPQNHTINHHNFTGKTLWVYGGGSCFPPNQPSSQQNISRIVDTTVQQHWDGVDFDDECNMNTSMLIESMSQLKKSDKESSVGFIAGYNYNHPLSKKGRKLNEKIQAIIESGKCDRLVHYCYSTAMWDNKTLIENVRPALERSINYGMPREKIILALTTKGLTTTKLHYFLDQIIDLNLGGLFMWRYHKLKKTHRDIIKQRLNKAT